VVWTQALWSWLDLLYPILHLSCCLCDKQVLDLQQHPSSHILCACSSIHLPRQFQDRCPPSCIIVCIWHFLCIWNRRYGYCSQKHWCSNQVVVSQGPICVPSLVLDFGFGWYCDSRYICELVPQIWLSEEFKYVEGIISVGIREKGHCRC